MGSAGWTSLEETHPELKKEVLAKCYNVKRVRNIKPELGPPKLERFDT